MVLQKDLLFPYILRLKDATHPVESFFVENSESIEGNLIFCKMCLAAISIHKVDIMEYICTFSGIFMV